MTDLIWGLPCAGCGRFSVTHTCGLTSAYLWALGKAIQPGLDILVFLGTGSVLASKHERRTGWRKRPDFPHRHPQKRKRLGCEGVGATRCASRRDSALAPALKSGPSPTEASGTAQSPKDKPGSWLHLQTQTCEAAANVMVKADQDNHICRFIIRRQMPWRGNMP